MRKLNATRLSRATGPRSWSDLRTPRTRVNPESSARFTRSSYFGSRFVFRCARDIEATAASATCRYLISNLNERGMDRRQGVSRQRTIGGSIAGGIIERGAKSVAYRQIFRQLIPVERAEEEEGR